eukprot:TRINITY_DN524_c0_g3_i2.p1 TRINITY_DN524_c0_g3~~TRINITY_DN524_c0_g3_i2.p1  ORF type:complete len:632 (-),score=204.16 TRINITY_DN524_c0_g3_i2:22-1917(-)
MNILKEYGVTPEQAAKLCEDAIKAAELAHAPYSKFLVGCAILAGSGRTITAANVENVSYGGSICAERSAIVKLRSEGEKEIKAIAVYIKFEGYSLYPIPCAICRQVLAEFGYFPIICCKTPSSYIVKSVSSLCPYVFRYLTYPKHVFEPDPNNLTEIIDSAEYWLQMDPDIKTRQEVEAWLVHDNYKAMRKYMCKRIDFGTAGLRGQMGAGYSRMNFLVVQQAAQGLSKYLLEQFGAEECKNRGVAIGYDGRYNSKGYAHISAAVFKHFNIKCFLFEEYVCTPIVPYAVVKYNCLAGIMVTASHNPKMDNGYKVYWTNGAQIIEPHDKGIKSQILKNLPTIELGEYFDYEKQLVKYPLEPLREKTMNLYFEDALKQISINSQEVNAKCKPIVHTSMHGVGHIFFTNLMKRLGFKEPIAVKEQMLPDPEFSTVIYPNPEEGEGSLNLSFKTADANGCEIVLANDPDADRLAVAEKQKDGNWRIFTGDQLGSMFAYYFVKNYKGDLSKCALVASTVSSKMIKGIAEKYKLRFEETLTGFKWISNKVIDLEKEGYTVLFSYEEAIGFSIGSVVRDKDGVVAGCCFAQLYAQLCEKNMTLSEYLEEIYKDVGLSLIHICRCRRIERCRSRWSPYH